MAAARQYCTFRLGEFLMGVDVRRVQEVLRFQEMTRVPLAPQVVRGLINVRGRIVMAIDLRRKFQLPDRDGDARPANIIVRRQDAEISLLVDEVCDVCELDDATLRSVPSTLNPIARELLAGVHVLKDRLLLILSDESINENTLAHSPPISPLEVDPAGTDRGESQASAAWSESSRPTPSRFDS